MTAPVSRCLSAAGIRFMSILSRPGIPPLLRSAYRAADDDTDPNGVSVFRTRETRPGPGALCTPGTAVPVRLRMHPAAAACRLAAAGPCHPGSTTRPGMVFSRGISKGSLAFAPPGHSPRLWLPDGTGALGLEPRASHPAGQDPAGHAGAGTGLRHWPGVTSSLTTSLDVPTHNERQRVAMHGEERSSPGDCNVWLPRNLPEPGRSSPLNPQARPRRAPGPPAPIRCTTATPAARRGTAKPQLTTTPQSAEA
jgi:hypothetical protein